MNTATTPPATLDDLARVDGKAELINGRIVQFMPSGLLPSRVARRITRSLEDYVLRSAHARRVPPGRRGGRRTCAARLASEGRRDLRLMLVGQFGGTGVPPVFQTRPARGRSHQSETLRADRLVDFPRFAG